MEQIDLERFAKSNAIGSVVMVWKEDESGWEIWAHGHEDNERDPLSAYGNRLTVARGRKAKIYKSIDRAREAIRALGYTGRITIEG